MASKPRRAASTAAAVIEEETRSEDLLFVEVPKAFNLLDDLGIMHKFEAGEQNMRRKYAEHYYAKCHKVKVLKQEPA